MCSRFGEQSLTCGYLRGLEQHVLVLRTKLQDLLFERGRLRQHAVLAEAVGHAYEQLDGLVRLTVAQIEIAERVRCIPVTRLIVDDAAVFRDRLIQLALLDERLGIAKQRNTINGHESV